MLIIYGSLSFLKEKLELWCLGVSKYFLVFMGSVYVLNFCRSIIFKYSIENTLYLDVFKRVELFFTICAIYIGESFCRGCLVSLITYKTHLVVFMRVEATFFNCVQKTSCTLFVMCVGVYITYFQMMYRIHIKSIVFSIYMYMYRFEKENV